MKLIILIVIPFLLYSANVELNSTHSKIDVSTQKLVAPSVMDKMKSLYALYKYAKSKEEEYKKSFHIKYKTNDFNDTHILYYKKELEKSFYTFVQAKDQYELFEANIKKEIALECIDYHLKHYDNDDWLSRRNYRRNARNLNAKSDADIERAMKNERLMGKYFYIYDLNLVHSKIQKVTSKNNTNKVSPCVNNTSTKEIYHTFLLQYILEVNPTQDRAYKWLKLLDKKWPNLKNRVKLYQENLALQKKKIFEKEETLKRKRAPEQFYSAVTGKYTFMDTAYFVKYGVNLNMRFDKGKTALMLALENNKSTAVRRLIYAKVDLTLKDDDGNTVWQYVDKKRDSTSYMLMRILQERNNRPNFKCKNLSSSYNPKTDKVTLQCLDIDKSKWSPLAFAIINHENKKVKKYIDSNKYLNTLSTIGSTPIFFAIVYKNNKALDWLIDSGANLEFYNNQGNNPLSLSVIVKNTYAVKRLLENKVDMYSFGPNGKEIAFRLAVDNNDIEIVKLFLDMGMDVNYQYKSNTPFLSVASFYNCKKVEMFELLLSSGANPLLLNSRSQTTKDVLKDRCKDALRYQEHMALLKKYKRIGVDRDAKIIQ